MISGINYTLIQGGDVAFNSRLITCLSEGEYFAGIVHVS